MLKLVFYTGSRPLKVRHALPQDSFQSSCHWKGKIEFIVGPDSDYTMTWTSFLPDLDTEYALALLDLVGARYPVSSQYENLKRISPELTFSSEADEWVFFAGSFHPWHQGHQACLNLLPEDKICLVAPDRNPFKDLKDLNPVATILEISTKAKFKKNHYLVPTFLMRQEKNPTIQWMEHLKTLLPSHKFSLLLGFDSFASIKTWTMAQDLLPLLHTVYVVSRLEDDEDRLLALDEAHALSPELNVVFLGKHQFENLSSTAIRNRSF